MIKNLHYLLLLTFIIAFQTAFSQGDLMIMPKRLVFDGSERSQEISLANTGNDSATYAISFIQYKMKEDGGFEQITEPEDGQRFADRYLRYYPRRVSLAPNEAQTVRLQLTRSGEMTEGEYRSHLYFRAVEEQKALGTEDISEDKDNISINIRTVFGISIPVIIRNGTSTTEVKLTNISFNSGENLLSMDIERQGNMSVYGNLKVEYHSDSTVSEVGLVKGIAVYTPNKKRRFSFKLQTPEAIDPTKGMLVITYQNEDGEPFAKISHELK